MDNDVLAGSCSSGRVCDAIVACQHDKPQGIASHTSQSKQSPQERERIAKNLTPAPKMGGRVGKENQKNACGSCLMLAYGCNSELHPFFEERLSVPNLLLLAAASSRQSRLCDLLSSYEAALLNMLDCLCLNPLY